VNNKGPIDVEDAGVRVFAFREIAWAPIPVERRVEGGAVFQMQVRGAPEVRIPALDLSAAPTLVAEGPRPGSRGERLACHLEGGLLSVTVPDSAQGRWIYY